MTHTETPDWQPSLKFFPRSLRQQQMRLENENRARAPDPADVPDFSVQIL
jgi:hypothetical protein